ncbi:MAG: 3-deoxy-manno-octulosonate cytidylyltransferase [Desulfuromonadaceae bacterium]|nr:3-deoxy-manno-octulosonate cytidylyltransferase [Desulfuromonadaceae bacterium]
MKVVAIIPARYASTRFPGKPLVDICGKPMIQHVYERTRRATSVDQVLVATDDERIASVVRFFGGDVVLTRSDHETGTDRLAEVAEGLDCQLIVNVQGDEPLIDPVMIDEAVAPLRADAQLVMGTLMTPLRHVEEYANPNVVKVVTDRQGLALYFSRAPIPCGREIADIRRLLDAVPVHKHVGLYVYRREFLLNYARLAPTPLEQAEKLEQLRALEHGFRIHVARTQRLSQGVDTPEDLERVRQLMMTPSARG